MGIIIEGLSRADNKKLYEAIEKAGNTYGLTRIKIKTVEDGFVLNSNYNSMKVSRELPELLNKGELEAALAHEFSHIYHGDPKKDLIMAVPFIILAILYPITNHYVNNDYYLYILITPILLAVVYLIICVMVLHKWDKRSDQEAAMKTSIPAMIGMLEKRRKNVTGFDPLHPTIDNRIKWVRNIESK
jgi:hypothetical protein